MCTYTQANKRIYVFEVRYLGNVLLAYHVLSRFDVLHATNQMRDDMVLALNACTKSDLQYVLCVSVCAWMFAELHDTQIKFKARIITIGIILGLCGYFLTLFKKKNRCSLWGF